MWGVHCMILPIQQSAMQPAPTHGQFLEPKKVKVKKSALLLVSVKRHLPRGVLGRQVEPQGIAIKPHPQSPSPTNQDLRPC